MTETAVSIGAGTFQRIATLSLAWVIARSVAVRPITLEQAAADARICDALAI